MLRCGSFDERLFVAEVVDVSLLRNIVEKSKQLIELLLLDGIIFMVMAACASGRQAQPNGRSGFSAIGDILNSKLLGNDSPLRAGAMIAMERGGNPLLPSGVGQQIPGELLYRELIEGHVAVKRINHPIPPP